LITKLTAALLFTVEKKEKIARPNQNENRRAGREITTFPFLVILRFERRQPCPSNISSDATYLKNNVFGEFC